MMGNDTIGGIMKTLLTIIIALTASNAYADYCIRDLYTGKIIHCYPPHKGN
jgi:hypothetical protein